MDEVQNESIEQETTQDVAQPETESTEIEQQQNQAIENRNDRNWRELRKSKEEWERKAKVQEELLSRLLAQQSPQQVHQEDEIDVLEEIAKEDYVPGEKVVKGLRKIEEKWEKKLKEVENRYQQTHQNTLIQDLKREFPDFDDVVNSETIAILEETNPRLSNAIAQNKDPYLMAVQSYEYIKAKGIHSKTPVTRKTEVERKLEQNKKTVQSPMAYDKRPIAQAFKMTESMQKELYNEMIGYAQQVGMGY